ncbi:cathelicidin antimicrobial peptide [Rattus norvegicus]|uniref:Cathelicidin antimicrobial peptide n=2 Tax=Rattus norvegicus TaxID=10116 RepID=G3V8S9_RAT|nr:cathelicidin antimicrobial peptide precursor [Rattus norvegicus]EDL77100.1 cathelicidin antimicrobial peptide [Rattus norvegicus]|eukprot:NP_001094194.1 cathelicidin antimicrobial peptide precursor [Rattus norvegicus]
MQPHRDVPSLWRSLSLLLLLGLGLPLAVSQTLSYREAVLRAVDDFNQQSLDTNLYRLLDLDSEPQGDEDPDTPKYVRFRVKETVCSKASQQLPEQCAFKEQGVVKQCMGTVTLNQAAESFDISCDAPGIQPFRFKKISRLAGLLRKGGEKFGEKLRKIGQKIKDFFQKLAPEIEQ